MTIIAWDGRTLAADKQSESSGKISTVTKIIRLSTGEVLAWTGDHDSGLLMAKWYANGADIEKWPACQRDKDQWSLFIVSRN